MSSTPSAPAPATAYRRSSRLAAKPAVTYTEPTETPDELLMERTKAMYEVFIEERLASATRNVEGVYLNSKWEFPKLYKDLPEDDVERVAAETYVKSLVRDWENPILRKYTMARANKALKEKHALADAKLHINEDMYKQAINAYNEILALKDQLAMCESTLAKRSAEIRTVLQSERSKAARTDIKGAIKKYAEKKFRTLHGKSPSSIYAYGFLSSIRTGKFPKGIDGLSDITCL